MARIDLRGERYTHSQIGKEYPPVRLSVYQYQEIRFF